VGKANNPPQAPSGAAENSVSELGHCVSPLRPPGLIPVNTDDPRLTPWARIFRHSVARVLSRASCGLRGLDQPFEAPAILDVIGARGVVVRFGAGVVEDDHHVRLDRDAAVIAAREGVL